MIQGEKVPARSPYLDGWPGFPDLGPGARRAGPQGLAPMMFPRTRRALTPGLLLGLAFSVMTASSARAQIAPSPRGTRTGSATTGAAPAHPPATGRGAGGFPRDEPIPVGPGATVTFPDENSLIPLDILDVSQAPRGPGANQQSAVTETQLKYARRIPAAGDRSLALSRIASAATFSNQLELADHALSDASDAAVLMTPGLVQDQRLMSIITALMGLAEARLREARTESNVVDLQTATEAADKPATAPAPIPKRNDPNRSIGFIRQAEDEWRKASALAQRVGNPTYRSEMMYRVADSLSFGSQSIVNEFPRGTGEADPGKDAAGLDRSFGGLPDKLLQDAANLAAAIDRPVWHDQALYKVATAAAESKQYSRALTVARMIPSPEVRTNALLKVAELQARRGDPDGATGTYRESALAVASMTESDPRAVLAGVLIDSLISVGRFDDARASVVLYPDESRRMIALGAVAESQGRRGSGLAALQWINATAPPRYRSWLYRKVNSGLVAAIEDNRRRDLSNRER
jgi:hypothetical protein